MGGGAGPPEEVPDLPLPVRPPLPCFTSSVPTPAAASITSGTEAPKLATVTFSREPRCAWQVLTHCLSYLGAPRLGGVKNPTGNSAGRPRLHPTGDQWGVCIH